MILLTLVSQSDCSFVPSVSIAPALSLVNFRKQILKFTVTVVKEKFIKVAKNQKVEIDVQVKWKLALRCYERKHQGMNTESERLVELVFWGGTGGREL